jgi:hypothetical protein
MLGMKENNMSIHQFWDQEDEPANDSPLPVEYVSITHGELVCPICHGRDGGGNR